MQLHDAFLTVPRRRRRRIGRGGKRGTYSGRGLKGQRSRSGARIRPAIRDVIKRIPKQRGYRFSGRRGAVAVINLRDLERVAQAGDTINLSYLRAHGLLGAERQVKILAAGRLTKALKFKGCQFSQAALKLITKAGGQRL